MSNIDNTRIIVSTIKDGKVQFGQAVMEQQPDPKRVILVALDPDFGLLYWECSHRRLKPHTVPQHAGYSRCLRPFFIDEEPSFLGEGYELPKENIPDWQKLMEARTNAKNKLIREIFA
jgi:hypothetical protein